MATAVSEVLAAGPWVFLGVVALVVVLVGFLVVMVRSAPTKMRVKFWKFEIERGDADPPVAALTGREPPGPPETRPNPDVCRCLATPAVP